MFAEFGADASGAATMVLESASSHSGEMLAFASIGGTKLAD